MWERLDTSLAKSAGRIRTAAFPEPSQAVDEALIAPPITLGGVGILSFMTCAPLAFAAASEASDTLLAPLLDQEIDTARFRGIHSSTYTDSASRGCDSLQALWGPKPAGTRRDMPQESPLDHGKA
jgi:hypothetical protein